MTWKESWILDFQESSYEWHLGYLYISKVSAITKEFTDARKASAVSTSFYLLFFMWRIGGRVGTSIPLSWNSSKTVGSALWFLLCPCAYWPSTKVKARWRCSAPFLGQLLGFQGNCSSVRFNEKVWRSMSPFEHAREWRAYSNDCAF